MSKLRSVTVVLALALVQACVGSDTPGDPDESGFQGRVLPTPVAEPDMVFPDMHGEPWDLRAETRDRVALVFFGYTYCPDVCPVHMANLAAVLRDLPLEQSRRIVPVFVTVDPERDTPERLREWLGALHPRFVGLRPTREQVTAVEGALGLPASIVEPGEGGEDYFVGHASQILAFGLDDTARVAFPWGIRQQDWLHDLPLLLRGEVPGEGD